MTNIRWLFEVEKMKLAFPSFEPFLREGKAGFVGGLRGKSGRTYQVTIEVRAANYPAKTPKIFIKPWVGPNRYLDGSLCVSHSWRPTRDTFAQQVLFAADYLQLHG